MSEIKTEVKEVKNEVIETGEYNPLNVTQFNHILRVAGGYSKSSIVPETYQGKPENCFVAVEMAQRMNLSPIFIMQNMFVVKGKPSWSGSACKSLIENSGRYSDVEYIMTGSQGKDDRGCFIRAVLRKNGKVVDGPEVTMAMAKAEEWYQKAGSKWKTMPEMMLRYRAAAFFARTECPEALMGMQTVEEVYDVELPVAKVEKVEQGRYAKLEEPKATLTDLLDELTSEGTDDE